MHRLALPIVVLVLALATPIGAAVYQDAQVDRFRLWNACQPVRLAVEDLHDDAWKISLRKADIETAVRSCKISVRVAVESQAK